MIDQTPRAGIFGTVRNRRAVIARVVPFDGHDGRMHLVQVEYKDDQLPASEELIWELEPRRQVLEPTAIPDVWASDPMNPDDFDALARTVRWSAAMPYLSPDGTSSLDDSTIASPFHSAVQFEDFQFVPLLKALSMPRINLLIADDVGFGKTIEAGMILNELLLRKRVQRVLILTPASSLRMQWQEEMWDKFSLPFDFVDRRETTALRKRAGMDANPWRAFNKIIASYYYLRQDDILAEFLSACQTAENSPQLPWDLLIVDECHNLMPSPFGEDSDLCKMLRVVAPHFEHRIFLSATPHNGHTRSFTGLLEILDPVRFSQTDLLRPAERERIQEVVVRRLKREINERTDPPRFCHRNPPAGIHLALSSLELELSMAFSRFRVKMRAISRTGSDRTRRAGSFAVEILGKRLLSCPTAFAESWRRCKEGLAERDASELELDAARILVERDSDDDRETQSRELIAASIVGSWLRSVVAGLENEIASVDRAIQNLGFDLLQDTLVDQVPAFDARFEALRALIDSRLCIDNAWRDDERIIVFTEYKTTLDYIIRRLGRHYESDRLLTLFGSGGAAGMDEGERSQVKAAFNDIRSPARILVATDAAAEGLNLQRTARFLLHFDCPWNPSKLEQRNGRIDRHGQGRDVTIFHFVSEQDDDIRFLAHVVNKAADIREDLGSVNELFDRAFHRRLVAGESATDVQGDLDANIRVARGRAHFAADATSVPKDIGRNVISEIERLSAELDYDSTTLRETLETAMSIRGGRPQLRAYREGDTYQVLHPSLNGWAEVIDDSLRQSIGHNIRGPVKRLAFTVDPFLTYVGKRKVFSPQNDLSLMHLSHPVIQRALVAITRRRFPGTSEEVSRWIVRVGDLPDNLDGLVLLTIEELGVNDLREYFHHWVRTVRFPIKNGKLQLPLSHHSARALSQNKPTQDIGNHLIARELLDNVTEGLRAFLRTRAQHLTDTLTMALATRGAVAYKEEEERYRSRQGEVSALIAENTIAKLEREIRELRAERQQGFLFEEEARLDDIDRSIEQKQQELTRRKRHFENIRDQLSKERERILGEMLPRRFALAGAAQVFPVTLELCLPARRP